MQVDDISGYFTSLLSLETVEYIPQVSAVFRSHGPHLNSGVRTSPRIYGGTYVGHAHLAAKLFWNLNGQTTNPTTVFVNFLSIGACENDIYYQLTQHDSNHVFVDIHQDGKTLARVFVKSSLKVEGSELISASRKVVDYVLPPNKNHIPQLYLISKMDLFAWRQHQDVLSSPMEMRCVEYGTTWDDVPHSIAYVRVPPEHRNLMTTKDPISILMYLSDWYIVQAISNHFRLNGRFFKSALTLNHHVELIKPDFDPFQWFLIHSKLETMSFDRAGLNAVVYSEEKVPLAVIRQEMFAENVKMNPVAKANKNKPGSKL